MGDWKSRSKTLTARLGVALLLAAAPALASGADVILSGADVWNTNGTMTFSSFAGDPIPAGFFCEGSRPFDGRISFRGVPLATDPPGYLGSADTVVHRLDDAVFDEEGVAVTRLKFMALSLAGMEPVDVGCAHPYDVLVTLDDGDQPVSEMKIFKETEDGGVYRAPLELRVKLSFVPHGDVDGEVRSIARDVSLAPGDNSHWTTTARVGRTGYGQPVKVDTDGDGVADSSFPGYSNFDPGYVLTTSATPYPTPPTCPCGQCVNTSCHCNPDSTDPSEPSGLCEHLHCIYYCGACPTIVRCDVELEPGSSL